MHVGAAVLLCFMYHKLRVSPAPTGVYLAHVFLTIALHAAVKGAQPSTEMGYYTVTKPYTPMLPLRLVLWVTLAYVGISLVFVVGQLQVAVDFASPLHFVVG